MVAYVPLTSIGYKPLVGQSEAFKALLELRLVYDENFNLVEPINHAAHDVLSAHDDGKERLVLIFVFCFLIAHSSFSIPYRATFHVALESANCTSRPGKRVEVVTWRIERSAWEKRRLI